MAEIHTALSVRPIARLLGGVLLCVLMLLGIVAPAARAAGNIWYVTTPSDDVSDGTLSTRSGSLRFVLAHAASGDFVSFDHYDAVVDTIFVYSTLTVPDGVTIGHRRDQDCGSYRTPLINVEDAFGFSLDPIFRLGVGSTLRNIDIGGGRISVKITGADADVCGVGLGLEYDADGNVTTLPPSSAALIVDGSHATIHRNYINGPVVVSARGSDSRIGDAIGGSGDTDDGVRDASVTVFADAIRAAQRVTIRDPFPRGLFGIVGNGVSGGDDVINHANNWAQKPTIASAYTYDSFATVQVRGIANPLSLVDIFFDNQITVARQPSVMADATGAFTFTGALPGSTVWVIAASTLDDAAHPGRVGSSSEFSGQVRVTAPVSTTAIQLAPPALTFTSVVSGPLPPGQNLLVTVLPGSLALQWQTSVTTTLGSGSWLSATPMGTGNGTISVTVNPAGLVPGTFQGSVTVMAMSQPTNRATSAVTLIVLPATAPPPLRPSIWLPLILR